MIFDNTIEQSPSFFNKMKGIFLIFLTILFFGGCAADYTDRTKKALRNFESGNFEAALEGYEKEKKTKKDRLVYLIDRGIVLHTAGRYEESIKILQEADEYSEKIDFAHTGEEILSLFTNERVRTYKGEAFERILINVYKAIGYIMLGNIEDALVECRKIDLKLEKFNKFLKTDQKDPFPRYISGVLFESDKEINDAYIDYKFVHKIDPDFYYLASDLLTLSKKLSFLDDYSKWQKIFGPQKAKLRPRRADYGELVLIYECGRSPKKISSEHKEGIQIIPIPVYVDRDSDISHAEIYVKGKIVARTHLLSDVAELSKVYLKKRIGAYIAKGVARLAIKTGAAVAIGKATKSPELGILAGLLLMHSNRADLRSALTFPENIQLARVFLKEGTHDVKLKFRSKFGTYISDSKVFKNVKIKRGEKAFLNYRTFR